MADEKDFQELTLTSASLTGSLVAGPGYVSIGGTFDTAGVTITLTGDNVPISINSIDGATFANPVLTEISFPVNATRLTFTAAGGLGSENISVKWYQVRQPY